MAGDHYIPEHPLPHEIQKMDRDDTVCQFCGVSYLIHNEMKALLKRVEEAEKTMEHYKGSVEREEQLKVKVKELEGNNESLIQTLQASEERSRIFLQEISTKDENINKLNDQNQQLENQMSITKQENAKLKQLVSRFKNSYPEILSHVKRHQTDLKNLKTAYNVNIKGINDFCQGMVAFVEEMCKKIAKDFDNVKLSLSRVESEKANLEKNCIQLKEKSNILEKEIKTLKNSENKSTALQATIDNIEGELSTYKQDITILKQKVKEQVSEILKYKENESSHFDEIDSLQQRIKTIEESGKKDKQKLQEVIINKEKELYTVMKELEELKEKVKNLSKTEHETKLLASDSEKQLMFLKESLSNAKNEIESLQDEREKMITAHHNRIEQLRESFKSKMNEADAWPEKLSKAMQELQEKHKEEKDDLWKELNASFQKELDEEQQRHAKELSQWKSEAKNTQEKFRQDINNLTKKHHQEIQQLQHELEEKKKQVSTAKDSSSTKITTLEAKIKDLQTQINKRSSASVDQVSSLTSRVQELEDINSNTERRMIGLETELTSAREQVEVLQDTVRRECEERLELTEALTEARTQLLSLQRVSKAPSQTSLTSVNSSSSFNSRGLSNGSSVCLASFDGIKSLSKDSGHQSRSGSVDESRQRIYNALGRSGSKGRHGDSR